MTDTAGIQIFIVQIPGFRELEKNPFCVQIPGASALGEAFLRASFWSLRLGAAFLTYLRNQINKKRSLRNPEHIILLQELRGLFLIFFELFFRFQDPLPCFQQHGKGTGSIRRAGRRQPDSRPAAYLLLIFFIQAMCRRSICIDVLNLTGIQDPIQFRNLNIPDAAVTGTDDLTGINDVP